MRQKKSNLPYYIITAVLLAAIGFIIFTDVPMPKEHIEEVVK